VKEPRRPQVGDWIPVACDDEGNEICGAPAQAWEPRRVVSLRTGGFTVAARTGGSVGYNLDEEGVSWRWPATQGALSPAKSSPACTCSHPEDRHFETVAGKLVPSGCKVCGFHCDGFQAARDYQPPAPPAAPRAEPRLPTIAQLEALVNDGQAEIEIMPSGEVRTKAGSAGDRKPLTMRKDLGGEYGAESAPPATQGAAVAGPAGQRFVCANCGADFRYLENLAEHMRGGHETASPPPHEPRTESVPIARSALKAIDEQTATLAAYLAAERAAKAALEVQLAEALILVAPFGGGDLLVGIRHLQRSLEREIEEHQRHHDKDEEREHLIQSLRQEVDDGQVARAALAVQLKNVREALGAVAACDAHHGQAAIVIARAALAASG
jgi:hypothetical protein